MNADPILLYGAGLPLLICIVIVPERPGSCGGDRSAPPARRRAALGLLFGVLAVTALVPASRRIDTLGLRFPAIFEGHALLLTFLVAWWLLAGRPPLLDFL